MVVAASQEVNDREIQRLAALDTRSWWIRGRREILRDAIRAHLGAERGPVVDVGCGAGGLLDVLRPAGPVLGIDISPLAAALCRERGYGGVAVGSALALPVAAGRLALIALTDVLEHLPADEPAVRECVRALRPGGLLVITVPAGPWLYSAHDRALGHYRRYRARDLVRLADRVGLRIERLTHFNAVLLPAVAAARLLRRGRQDGAHAEADRLDLPAPWHAIAAGALRVERRLLRAAALPVGLSLLCVARKPRAPATSRRGGVA